MRSEAEIRKAIEQVMRVAENLRAEPELLARLAALRGVLNWVIGEESSFGELLQTWQRLEDLMAAIQRQYSNPPGKE